MNPFIDQIFRDGTALDDQGNPVEVFTAGVARQDGEDIYKVIRASGAHETLEIGFAYGISTLFILQALQDNGGGRHEAIDPFEKEAYRNVGIENVRRSGLGHLFTFHHAFSQDLLPQFLIAGRKFDFVFIDGHHTFDQVFTDFYYVEKILRDGGLVMFHDVILPSVRKVVTFILRNMKNFELAMEPLLQPMPSWLRWYHTLRLMRTSPTEPYSWRLAPIWATGNVCVVRRLGPDSRDWSHYCSF